MWQNLAKFHAIRVGSVNPVASSIFSVNTAEIALPGNDVLAFSGPQGMLS
jgi:hypothetical protein